ncbi:MAG: hypothetical protein CK533_09985 [Acidobacterium sp.]|nr:hypothetical protein [Acidobacteriota bacterium]PHY10353.1 MAG: hypothetical protein CK533_09985 [Acidobacterium sp.]
MAASLPLNVSGRSGSALFDARRAFRDGGADVPVRQVNAAQHPAVGGLGRGLGGCQQSTEAQ